MVVMRLWLCVDVCACRCGVWSPKALPPGWAAPAESPWASGPAELPPLLGVNIFILICKTSKLVLHKYLSNYLSFHIAEIICCGGGGVIKY